MSELKFDVIVIGGGHAGSEAAYAASKIGAKVALITANLTKIGAAPCNPSIGGPAKGIVVREIAAFDGLMNKAADATSLQVKILNHSKGAAVHALRSQIDKDEYPKFIQKSLKEQKNIELIEDFVIDILTENMQITGVKLKSGQVIRTKTLILTTGTYMDSIIVNGKKKEKSGPMGEKTTDAISKSLKDLGIDLFRLKTGTPPRIAKESIDFTQGQVAAGDKEVLSFSFYTKANYQVNEQLDCYLIHTNQKTHEVINNNLHQTGLNIGTITGTGPRYCPSIEEKIIRFADKERHQLFLEPETKNGNSIYLQGLSTSLPYDVQDEIIATLPGLENARVLDYGYAIEYDAVYPHQLKNTLEFKKVKNFYSAGQINATSGYEEAAGQGLIAGINAANRALNREEFRLLRTNSYIGLMIDDLVTKGTTEPYRLLTSRAEHRLLLRHDNADLRLSHFAYQLGLLTDEQNATFKIKVNAIKELKALLNETKITPKILTKEKASEYHTQPLSHGITAIELLKRPEIKGKQVVELLNIENYTDEIIEEAEIQVKYAGYIEKINRQLEKSEKMEKTKLSEDIDYNNLINLSLEAREKLTQVKPETLAQASRISGVTPADISIILIHLKKGKQ